MKVLIIDDERLARQELRNLLGGQLNIDIVGEAKNADEALLKISELQPDLLLLDVQMPGKDGFELLQEVDLGLQVVFVTAYDQHAIRAFEVNAIDYLLKPVERPRLIKAISKVQKVLSERSLMGGQLAPSDKVFLKNGEQSWLVKLADITALESVGNYTSVTFNGHKPLIRRSLNQLEKRLPKAMFFRASRQYIVNVEFIERVETAVNGNLELTLVQGLTIEMSRRQSLLFRELNSL